MVVPAVLATFLGCAEGGDVAMIVDASAPVPSVTLRPAVHEVPST